MRETKFIIVGLHSSGKQQVIKDLASLGVRTGKIFRNTSNVKSSIYTLSDIVYTCDDINAITENQSYVFIKENRRSAIPFFEGLSSYEFMSNEVFVMSPDQFNDVPEFPKNVCFVWLDNSQSNRRLRHNAEKRKYDFNMQDDYETQDMNDFITRIYDNDILYFNNEEPKRVSAIIYSLLRHPELLNIYKTRYN